MLKFAGLRCGIATLGLLAGILGAAQSAEAAVIDSVSVFVAPGIGGVNPADLADWFESVSLRVDKDLNGQLPPSEEVSSGIFNAVTNSISNPDIVYFNTGKQVLQSSGNYDIWQVDFGGLNLSLPDNQTVRFGVKGIGRMLPGADGSGPKPDYYPWFLVAANAGLSGYGPNAYTDDRYLEFKNDGTLDGVINSNGNGWNKSSDILVQVFDQAGNRLTDRGLPSVITEYNVTRWVPPEAVYGNPLTARFKGDDFNTVPAPSLLLGAAGMGIQALRKKRQQRTC
jgi:hypothetical protein